MDKNVDTLIKEALKVQFDSIPCPPKEEILKGVRSGLKRMRRKEIFRRLRPIIAACAMFAVIVSLVSFHEPVMAFTNRFIKTLMEITDNTIKIHKKVVTSDDLGKEDYFFGRNIDDPRIGEVQKKIHFKLLIPEYIPEGYRLNDVDLLNKYEKKETVTMFYIKTTENGEKSSFEISQKSFLNDSEKTMNIQKDEKTILEQIAINGLECTLVINEDRHALLWDDGSITREIAGSISKEDIIKIAGSMK